MRIRTLIGVLSLICIAACGRDASAPPIPAVLAIESGAGQEAQVGTPFPAPIVVRVSDRFGAPVPGIHVSFTAPDGGQVGPAEGTTDSRGLAATRWTAGGVPGATGLTVEVKGLQQLIVPAVVRSGNAATIERVTPDAQAAAAGGLVVLRVLVRDGYGNPVPGAAVEWSVSAGGGQMTAARPVSDDAGIHEARWRLGELAGTQRGAAAIPHGASVEFSALAHPAILSIRPFAPFQGDTVVLEGHGLRGGSVNLSGIPAGVIASLDTALSFIVPSGMPTCRDVRADVPLEVSASGLSADTALQASQPITLALSLGGHAVLPEVAAGCPMILPAGTYGVALYRMAAPAPSRPSDFVADSAKLTLRLRPRDAPAMLGSLGVVHPETIARPRRHPGSLPSDGRLRLTHARVGSLCVRPPGAVGDTLILSDEKGSAKRYQIAATTEHLNWLFPLGVYDTLPARMRQRFPAVVAAAEPDVYSFLERMFAPLPDVDTNGRLDVIIDGMPSYGGAMRYRDGGCPQGDFVNAWLSDPRDYYAPEAYIREGELNLLMHEAAHWIDLQMDSPFDPRVEGFAVLVTRIWGAELEGASLWGGHDDSVRPGWSDCSFAAGRYAEYTEDPYGYGWGCAQLRYLVDQRIWEGAQERDVLRALKDRDSRGELLPVWTQLGGAGRTEAELQGEMELMQYADGLISPLSPRLQNRSFTIYNPRTREADGTGTPYFVARADVPRDLDVWLSSPDGIVFELEVLGEGAAVRLASGTDNRGFALVRRF